MAAAVSRKMRLPARMRPAGAQKVSQYFSTDGMTPAAPFVGAVTTRPPAAFSSFTASA